MVTLRNIKLKLKDSQGWEKMKLQKTKKQKKKQTLTQIFLKI